GGGRSLPQCPGPRRYSRGRGHCGSPPSGAARSPARPGSSRGSPAGRTARGWFGPRPDARPLRCAPPRREPPEWRSAGCARRTSPRGRPASSLPGGPESADRGRRSLSGQAAWRRAPGRSTRPLFQPAVPADEGLQVPERHARSDLEPNPFGGVPLEEQLAVPQDPDDEVHGSAVQHHDLNGELEEPLQVVFKVEAEPGEGPRRVIRIEHPHIHVAPWPGGSSGNAAEEVDGSELQAARLPETGPSPVPKNFFPSCPALYYPEHLDDNRRHRSRFRRVGFVVFTFA